MKKMFTLLFGAFLASGAFAQQAYQGWDRHDDDGYREHGRNHDRDRDRDRDGDRFQATFVYDGIRYPVSQRDDIIRDIDARYDDQIQRLANDWDMAPWYKRKMIDRLQDRKADEIRSIGMQCESSYNAPYGDNYGDNRGYYR